MRNYIYINIKKKTKTGGLAKESIKIPREELGGSGWDEKYLRGSGR